MSLNKELLMVVMPAVGWLLFSLGGTQVSDTIKGQKWVRRFLLPAFLGLFCAVAGVQWWLSAIVSGIYCLLFILGYGEGKSWGYRAALGIGYAAATLPIGVSWWNAITAAAFLILFILSNLKITARTFTWKLCEGFFGLFCAIQLSYLLARAGGIVWPFVK